MSPKLCRFDKNASAQVPLERKFPRKQRVCYGSATEKKAIGLEIRVQRLERIIEKEYQSVVRGLVSQGRCWISFNL